VAKTPRSWTGARTPSGLKRVRQAERRREVLQPRRSAAKTYVAKALAAATHPTDGSPDPAVALVEALSALDRAAKLGAIHPNAAARRKSRLTRKVNAAVGGAVVATTSHATKTTGKAAAVKAAKARIAASKADKAKGAQTAAGKARAALTRSTRSESAAATAETPPTPAKARATGTRSSGPKAAGQKAGSAKSASPKASAPKASAPKASAPKASAPKAAAPKATAKSTPKARSTKKSAAD
jgi:carnitine O-acetyltransferase